MGGAGDTKKSLGGVKADLNKQLTDNARGLLKKDFNVIDNTTNLETLLNKLAANRFRQTYKYEFYEDSTNMYPPANLGDVRASAKICSIVPPIGNQVNEYLKAGIFSKLDLPQWMEQTAINDLSNIADTIISRDTEKQWRYSEYRRTYDARKEDQDTYVCNSILVFCHGNLIEDGSRAELAVIYYVGVYYKITSQTKHIRDQIQASAYSGAQKLVGGNTPSTDALLKDSLDTFAKTKFQSEFGFQYGSTPPDSYRAQQIDSAFVTQNSQLYYVPDTKSDDLANYIEHQVYSGINIPLPSAKNTAIKDTFAQFKSILNSSSTGSWNVTRLDKTYIPADPTNNPIRQTGLIMSWYGHQTTDAGASLSVTYIYLITMFYECQSADQELACEIFKNLCNTLPRLIGGDNSQDNIADPAKLKEFMSGYAKQEFQKKFGFEYRGKQSTPPNKKPGGKVSTYEELFQIKSIPAELKEVQDWMDAEVFKRDDRKFPPFAMAPIYDDIVNHILRYAAAETIGEKNWWYCVDFTREYYDNKIDAGRDIQQFAFYLYALGDMTLNKVGCNGQEGVHVKRLFVYYLGVFSSYDTDAASW